jgi:hypothetical protein
MGIRPARLGTAASNKAKTTGKTRSGEYDLEFSLMGVFLAKNNSDRQGEMNKLASALRSRNGASEITSTRSLGPGFVMDLK